MPVLLIANQAWTHGEGPIAAAPFWCARSRFYISFINRCCRSCGWIIHFSWIDGSQVFRKLTLPQIGYSWPKGEMTFLWSDFGSSSTGEHLFFSSFMAFEIFLQFLNFWHLVPYCKSSINFSTNIISWSRIRIIERRINKIFSKDSMSSILLLHEKIYRFDANRCTFLYFPTIFS